MTAPIESPCILVCTIDTDTGYCFGCGRTRQEITGWMNYSVGERRSIMAVLETRLATVVRKPRRQTKRKRIANRRRQATKVGEA